LSVDEKNIKTISYRRWQTFVSMFPTELYGSLPAIPSRFLFRGQGSDAFRLHSSFDRAFSSVPLPERVRKYDRIRSSFCELYQRRFGGDVDEMATLSIAQHNGLPTRLLDWTSNPLVAAYFAFNKAALNNHTKGRVCIWAIEREHPLVHHTLGLTIFEAPRKQNERAQAQRGYFSHLTGTFEGLEEFAEHGGQQERPLLYRFIVPVSDAVGAFSFLHTVGVDSYSLFPDIQGLTYAALESEWLSVLKQY